MPVLERKEEERKEERKAAVNELKEQRDAADPPPAKRRRQDQTVLNNNSISNRNALNINSISNRDVNRLPDNRNALSINSMTLNRLSGNQGLYQYSTNGISFEEKKYDYNSGVIKPVILKVNHWDYTQLLIVNIYFFVNHNTLILIY